MHLFQLWDNEQKLINALAVTAHVILDKNFVYALLSVCCCHAGGLRCLDIIISN